MDHKTSQLAHEALATAAADPSPRALHGSSAMPGFFAGSSATAKAAAKLCIEKGWLVPTGEFTGKGKTRKELYQITPAGLKEVFDHGETPVLLRQLREAAQGSAERLKALLGVAEELRVQAGSLQTALSRQQEILAQIQNKLRTPDFESMLQKLARTTDPQGSPVSPPTDQRWLDDVLAFLEAYRRQNPARSCSLAELYRAVAQPRGLTIGQFHDGVRALSRQGRIILHEWTQAMHQLTDEQYALLEGKEIRYYVERRDR